ncbi:hypothetical protein ABZT06_21190 [Streptomyces sp. NPDC005483]
MTDSCREHSGGRGWGGPHLYVSGAGRAPEADAAIARICVWVREKAKV